MKKSFLKTLAFLLIAATALGSWAQEFSVGDLTYKVSGSGVYCTGLTGSAQSQSSLSVAIPSMVTYSGTTYRVNGIEANSFKDQTNIASVSIRWGTAYIEENAFQGCTGIGFVYLPSSIRSIGANAFQGCTALNSVFYAGFSFPSSGVSSSAFPSNYSMKLYIPYPSRKTPAQYKAQTGFTQFEEVKYASTAYDFYLATDGGTYCIGWPDDNGPSVTRSATLSGYRTGDASTNGGTVYRPTSHTYSVGGLSFEIDTIGAGAFQGQSTLKTIDLTNASKLKYFAAQDVNTGIQNVTALILPSSNFYFNTVSFLNFTSLPEFTLAAGNTIYSIYDGCLYNYGKTTLYKVPNAKEGEIDYPSTLKTLWAWCHCNCAKITHAMLPFGVTTINAGAFNNTPYLEFIRIPSSVIALSNDRVFRNTKVYCSIYCNMANPPTVTASSYFGDNSNMYLFVPYNKSSTYSDAGWTGFHAVNYYDRQAYDYPNAIDYNNLAYSVTSTASVTGADGNTYDGSVRVVCHGSTSYISAPSPVTIPPSITIGDKNYVVNKIGEYAFNHRTSDFTVEGCVNIESIGDYAFNEQAVTSYAFTHNVSYIGNYAFNGSGLSGTICLPYGVKKLGYYSFGNGNYSRLIVPSSLSDTYGTFCYGTNTLTELVLNLNGSSFYNYTGWNLTGVPSTCKILVPTGVVNQYKQNTAFSSRADYISAGAYDFAVGNVYNGRYFLTITSTAPVTFDGSAYAGKAKYVYHPNIQNYNYQQPYIFDNYEEDQTVSTDKRKYLITELGDSLLYGSPFTSGAIPSAVTRIGQSAFRNSQYAVNNLVLPDGLTFIGHDAFYNSKITGEVKIPSTVTTLEDYALSASTLNALYFPDMTMPTMGSRVWSTGIGAVWVPNTRANQYLNKANSWSEVYGNKIAVWIKPFAETQSFSSVVPTDFASSGIDAYYASAYNNNNTGKEVTMTKITEAPANTGLLLVGLTKDQESRISRPTGSVTAPSTNYLVGTPTTPVNVYDQSVGYYWEYRYPTNLRFVKPTTSYYTTIGGAYLKLSGSEAGDKSDVYTTLFPMSTGVYGDVNGDGSVTSSDVTTLYNYLLNNDTSNLVNGDVDGDGEITAADVTAVYNVLLGN